MSKQKLPKLWAGLALLSVILVCYPIHILSEVQTSSPDSQGVPSRRKLARINRHLDKINKQAVTTIQSVDGDIIDCVDISQQPAFDHPALVNHSVENPPEMFPLNTEGSKTAFGYSAIKYRPQLWHQSELCPEGTVAIRRTLMKDVLRAGSFASYRKKRNGLASVPQPKHPHSMSENGHEGDTYYGAQATINVWSPSVQVPSEFSLSQMWLLAGSFTGDLNSIEAGWQTDAYQATGCYNLLCSGFVQTSNEIAIGAAVTPVSSVDSSQYDIRILIWKDPIKGNWWMQFGDSYLVGYWPAAIFTHLASSATMLEWGGEVVNTQPYGRHSATSMGSGQFAEKGFAHASYVRNIKYVDANNVLKTPVGMQTLAEHPNCYDIQSSINPEWGAYFYYGGPGQNYNCP